MNRISLKSSPHLFGEFTASLYKDHRISLKNSPHLFSKTCGSFLKDLSTKTSHPALKRGDSSPGFPAISAADCRRQRSEDAWLLWLSVQEP
jgi:hypothetical protein